MIFDSLKNRIAAGFGAALLLGSMNASAAFMEWDLADHPDGANNPPPYGLRLDGVEWFTYNVQGLSAPPIPSGVGNSDSWGFSFEDGPASMKATYDSTTEEFRIFGTAFGGRDAGSSYASAPGAVAIDFTYSGVTMADVDAGIFYDATTSGAGTIEFLDDIESIAAGTVVEMVHKARMGDLAAFLFMDDSRLDAYCPGPAYCGNPVGEGWVQLTAATIDGTRYVRHEPYHTASMDFLFTTVVEPGTIGLIGLSLVGFGVAGARRKTA